MVKGAKNLSMAMNTKDSTKRENRMDMVNTLGMMEAATKVNF